jgi:hypothetical protein
VSTQVRAAAAPDAKASIAAIAAVPATEALRVMSDPSMLRSNGFVDLILCLS